MCVKVQFKERFLVLNVLRAFQFRGLRPARKLTDPYFIPCVRICSLASCVRFLVRNLERNVPNGQKASFRVSTAATVKVKMIERNVRHS